MFIGEYSHTIDNKGRLAVPVKFRTKLAEGAVITRGLDNCLFLYPRDEWQKMADKLSNLPISQANTRGFARMMLAGAMDVKIDSQGRVLVPDYLRRFANLKKEIIVAGLFNRLEVWDSTAWDKYRTDVETRSQEIAEKMGELGI
ncbi:MAG: cell division/cell wall cluster transcriptional repressor MraZ [Candidatus Portnoybacteria bacterium CG10_big_fil_rev_8_21_14_0_10_40_22]|uniref:Transcriptional regulator MraZ n=2 Tax=Candidatus Portnoyibacteriota TaxID=1817913 RepID=A0A2M8KFC0_9BACT|nr:MAG: cell division/cell wall cluster transcriptional repressor MraZ [Candidatus Portnoybacteria bacterium CG_4_10_14_0_2_um_filter_39_11]PJE58604.1 MAG: cell division/cell wall cluster transcriptional repressor MraZ [Candidatus Portnoybacteria bacterium CG10_big_fil_rev_8_21_14_0_10_40_22]